MNSPEPSRPPGVQTDLDLLTPDDVCALLKVRKSWLYDTVESGALEAVRLGKQLRFRPSAVARYLDSSTARRSGLDRAKGRAARDRRAARPRRYAKGGSSPSNRRAADSPVSSSTCTYREVVRRSD